MDNNTISKMNSLDYACLETEKILNAVGYIPVVGSFSALGRAALGTAQVIGGLACTVFAFLGWFLSSLAGNKKFADRCIQFGAKALNYVAQGIANNVRAFIERVPFLPLITTLPYDLSGFKIIRYPTEPANYQRNIDFIHEGGISFRHSLGCA